jgi:hypothetical protein
LDEWSGVDGYGAHEAHAGAREVYRGERVELETTSFKLDLIILIQPKGHLCNTKKKKKNLPSLICSLGF